MSSMKKGVITVIFSDDRTKVLLIKRRDVPIWTLPGGGIEKGESEEEAMLRETEEETGFKVEISRKVGDYTPINYLTTPTTVFECKIISGMATTGPETREIDYFPLDALPMRMPPPYSEWIEDAAKNLEEPLSKNLTTITYSILFKSILIHPVLVTRFLLTKLGLHINTK